MSEGDSLTFLGSHDCLSSLACDLQAKDHKLIFRVQFPIYFCHQSLLIFNSVPSHTNENTHGHTEPFDPVNTRSLITPTELLTMGETVAGFREL